MNKMKEFFREIENMDRILAIIIAACWVGVILMAILKVTGIFEGALYVMEPLLAVSLLTQSIFNWNKSRSSAIISLTSGIVIFICFIRSRHNIHTFF